jgi:hypothetical protein
MKTLITAIALVAFVAANGFMTSAYAQAPAGGAAPAPNAPVVAPTTPASPAAAPAKSTTHKGTKKSATKKTKKSTKSSAKKKSAKPSTQGSLGVEPSVGHAG